MSKGLSGFPFLNAGWDSTLPDCNSTFLQDGDTIIYAAHCERAGFATIGFGECRGTVVPAQS
jgi:hypothetical protein